MLQIDSKISNLMLHQTDNKTSMLQTNNKTFKPMLQIDNKTSNKNSNDLNTKKKWKWEDHSLKANFHQWALQS
jgi:hypothetical protein